MHHARRARRPGEVLWFDAGEHELVFEPFRAATLRGHVRGNVTGEFLALELVDEHGAPVPIATFDGFTMLTTSIEPDASGEFVIRNAPSGPFRLRLGTRAELAAGRWRLEHPLTLTPGENPRLELGL